MRFASRGVLLAGVLLASLSAPDDVAGASRIGLRVTPPPTAGGQVSFVPVPADLAAAYGAESLLVEGVPLSGLGERNLELTASSLVASDARFAACGPGGCVPVALDRVRAFTGRVSGEEGSRCQLMLVGGTMIGRVSHPGGEWLLRPPDLRDLGSSSAAIVVEEIGLSAGDERPCRASSGATWSPNGGPMVAERIAVGAPGDAGRLPRPRAHEGDTLVAELAMDSTGEYYAQFRDETAAIAYGLFLAQVLSDITLDELGVLMRVTAMVVRSGADPYAGLAGTGYSGVFNREWSTDPVLAAIPRDFAHVLGVGAFGTANTTSACTAFSWSDAARSNGSATERLVMWTDLWYFVHEIGHSLGARHTSCYDPPLDYCWESGDCAGDDRSEGIDEVGTVMGRCLRARLSFHPRIREEMRLEVDLMRCVSRLGDPGLVEATSLQVRPATEGPLTGVGTLVPRAIAPDDGCPAVASPATEAHVVGLRPSSFPFTVETVVAVFEECGSAPIRAGDSVDVLVYADPTPDRQPTDAVLVARVPATVPRVHPVDPTDALGSWEWFTSRFDITPPVVATGDIWVGFATRDVSAPLMDSFPADALNPAQILGARKAAGDGSDPSLFGSATAAAVWVEGHPEPGAGDLLLTWSPACNIDSVPEQDYGIYRGTIGGAFDNHVMVTCTTGRQTSYLDPNAPANSYYVVVPNTPDHEGSYGTIPVAVVPCLPQLVGTCN